MKKKSATLSAEELDRRFDAGEDISEFLDWDKAEHPSLAQRRVNLDLPTRMIQTLDLEAKRVCVPRQSVMKLWLAERIRPPHSPAPIPVLTVHGAAGAKANS